jgi:polyisoprenoid-binding protein YceI
VKRVLLAAVLALAPAAAHAAHWSVDPAKSKLGFSVQWNGEAFNATFKSWTADIDFDPAKLGTSKVRVRIDLSSEDSGLADNDDGLKGAEGFAVDKFPAATFTTTGFKAAGSGNYVATGQLNLHGVTKVVTLPFHLAIAGNTAHMTGKATVSRIDFGLGTGEWAADKPVAHAVTITVDLTATKTR